MQIFFFILVVIGIILVFRLNKLDKFRLNLQSGSIGKVFLIADETTDNHFYVVITKRISLTEVEVEYNIDFDGSKDSYPIGYYFSKIYRIKDICPVKEIESQYFSEGFKNRIEELKNGN